MKEKWQKHQFAIETGSKKADQILGVDDQEGDIFGVEVLNQNIEIGSVYIFCDSLANLL